VARQAGEALDACAARIGSEHGPGQEELTEVLREMPRLDLGDRELRVRRPILWALGRAWSIRSVARQLRSRLDGHVEDAIMLHARVFRSWVQQTFVDLQGRYEGYADAYRAQLIRLSGDGETDTHELSALQESLAWLSGQEA
jgi:hypothetical protein